MSGKKRIPKNEYCRDYRVEKDPNSNFRILKCDFEELEDMEDGWD